MLTARGWSFLIVTFLLLAVAMLDWVVLPLSGVNGPRYPNTTLEVIGLTLCGWFWFEWALFVYRARVVVRRLAFRRRLHDEHTDVDTLWSRQSFHVSVSIHMPGGLRLPYIRLTDPLPYGTDFVEGEASYEGALDVGEAVEWTYQLRAKALGPLRFEGVRVQVADPQGFFYFTTFLRGPDIYRVLPPLADDRGHTPTVKRFNLLPPPGVHRLRRTGSGSELLDLRDYQPGDPPKTIAWKASARRDRLITKEFESEVPLRCTLFLDTSESVRRGGPGASALTRLAEVTACVSQANAAARDLTGLCTFDESGATYLRPARGARHLASLLNRLTDAAGLGPTLSQLPMADLLPPAYAFAERTYPDLLRPEVNYFPDWIAWLWPQPAYTLRRPTFGDRGFQKLLLLLLLYLVGSFVALLVAVIAGILLTRALVREGQAGLAAILIGVIVFAVALLLFKLPGQFFPERRRQQRWRKQLAALLSIRYRLAPGGLALLAEDERLFADYLERFLSEHRVPVPHAGASGPAHFHKPEKLRVLAEALMRAVSKEHDNELFVLFVDLLHHADEVEQLLRAVKVAVARHHQVMLVLPWPRGVPLESGARRQESGARGQESEVRGQDKPTGSWSLTPDSCSLTPAACHEALRRIRRSFARFGVPVIPASGDEPTRLILERLERLRLVGGKR